MKILFICTHNRCRSIIAEAVCNHLGGEVLQARGVGGIADFTRIRCLHTWYAAHLVVPNTIGRLLDEHWAEESRGG